MPEEYYPEERLNFRVPYKCFECGKVYFELLKWNGWNFSHESQICCHPDAQSEKLAEAEHGTGYKDIDNINAFHGDIIQEWDSFGEKPVNKGLIGAIIWAEYYSGWQWGIKEIEGYYCGQYGGLPEK